MHARKHKTSWLEGVISAVMRTFPLLCLLSLCEKKKNGYTRKSKIERKESCAGEKKTHVERKQRECIT